MKRSPTRRQYLQSTALAGLLATAGCTSSARSDSTEDEQTTSHASATDAETTAATSPTETPTGTSAELDEWLADANGYGGDRERHGPGARPTVRVGEPTDDGMAFAPAAIEVPPMTEVRWDWTGHGGQHNVVALDGTFDSGRTNAQAGTEYHYIFEEPGTYRYVSEPDRDDGMRGAVIVREPPSTGNERVDEWVVHSSNFDGSVADETGSDTATVHVGASGNQGAFAFDPPVLKISAGATVVWKWTGDGGPHNVVFEDVDVGSGAVVHEPDATFEHTFESAGTYLYACEPHVSLGMRGAIVVEEA